VADVPSGLSLTPPQETKKKYRPYERVKLCSHSCSCLGPYLTRETTFYWYYLLLDELTFRSVSICLLKQTISTLYRLQAVVSESHDSATKFWNCEVAKKRYLYHSAVISRRGNVPVTSLTHGAIFLENRISQYTAL
jgi:hypothetical protein